MGVRQSSTRLARQVRPHTTRLVFLMFQSITSFFTTKSVARAKSKQWHIHSTASC